MGKCLCCLRFIVLPKGHARRRKTFPVRSLRTPSPHPCYTKAKRRATQVCANLWNLTAGAMTWTSALGATRSTMSLFVWTCLIPMRTRATCRCSWAATAATCAGFGTVCWTLAARAGLGGTRFIEAARKRTRTGAINCQPAGAAAWGVLASAGAASRDTGGARSAGDTRAPQTCPGNENAFLTCGVAS